MRLIDADNVISEESLDAYPAFGQSYADITDLREIIEDSETVDPVHAAGGCYCRECKHFDPNWKEEFADDSPPDGFGRCNHPRMDYSIECYDHWLATRPDDFCSCGVKKEDYNERT